MESKTFYRLLKLRRQDQCPVSILHKSIAGRYRPVRIADGPITTRCRFIKNASWVFDCKFYLRVTILEKSTEAENTKSFK